MAQLLAHGGDAGVEHAVGHRAHELVEHPDDDRPVALQLLDHAHAIDELVALALQILDLFDLLVEFADVLGDVVVARVLVIDLLLTMRSPSTSSTTPHGRNQAKNR
jgi:hypothetical protein